MLNNTPQIAHANNDMKVNKRNWSSYNEELVVRGELYFDFEKNLIRETEMKDMKWKAKNLLKEKSINVIEEIKSLKGEINEYL